MSKAKVKKAFGLKLENVHCGFRRYEAKSRYIFSGDSVFFADLNGVMVFIVLVPNHRGDNSFTIQFGWSRLCRFPEVATIKFSRDPMPPPDSRLSELEYMSRIGAFFPEKLGDYWWTFDTSDAAQVEQNLVSMIECIEGNVIPYLLKLINHQALEKE